MAALLQKKSVLGAKVAAPRSSRVSSVVVRAQKPEEVSTVSIESPDRKSLPSTCPQWIRIPRSRVIPAALKKYSTHFLLQSRRAALGAFAGAAALVSGAAPSLAAFGDSANVFGRVRTCSRYSSSYKYTHIHSSCSLLMYS